MIDPLSQEFISYMNQVFDSPSQLKELISEVKRDDMAFWCSLHKAWLKEQGNLKMTAGAIEHKDTMLLPDFTDEQLDGEIIKEQLDKIFYTGMKRFKAIKYKKVTSRK